MTVSGLQRKYLLAVGLEGVCFLMTITTTSDLRKEKVIVKSVNHFRIHNERDVLLRFQSRTSLFRPLLDEIEHPASSFCSFQFVEQKEWLDNVTKIMQ